MANAYFTKSALAAESPTSSGERSLAFGKETVMANISFTPQELFGMGSSVFVDSRPEFT